MSNLINVVGMDPSLRHWGIAKGTYDLSLNALNITELHVLETPPRPKESSDRARALVENGLEHKKALNALLSPSDTVFAEYPIGSQGFNSAVGYAATLILLGTLKKDGINIIEISPNEVKLATIGNRTASKQDIVNRAVQLYPDANWPYKKKKIVMGKAQHMADAIGTIEAGIKYLHKTT